MSENQEPDLSTSILIIQWEGNFIGPWAWCTMMHDLGYGSRDSYHIICLGYFPISIFQFCLVFLTISFQADAIISWTGKGFWSNFYLFSQEFLYL